MFWLINLQKSYCLKVLPENTINVNYKLCFYRQNGISKESDSN